MKVNRIIKLLFVLIFTADIIYGQTGTNIMIAVLDTVDPEDPIKVLLLSELEPYFKRFLQENYKTATVFDQVLDLHMALTTFDSLPTLNDCYLYSCTLNDTNDLLQLTQRHYTKHAGTGILAAFNMQTSKIDITLVNYKDVLPDVFMTLNPPATKTTATYEKPLIYYQTYDKEWQTGAPLELEVRYDRSRIWQRYPGRKIRYSWLKDGAVIYSLDETTNPGTIPALNMDSAKDKIAGSELFNILFVTAGNTDFSKLLIASAQAPHDGKYLFRIMVDNELAAESHPVQLGIITNPDPVIKDLPEELWAIEGQTIEIQCEASGAGKLYYQWIRDDETIGRDSSVKIKLKKSNKATFTIKCLVWNHRKVVESSILLHVDADPLATRILLGSFLVLSVSSFIAASNFDSFQKNAVYFREINDTNFYSMVSYDICAVTLSSSVASSISYLLNLSWKTGGLAKGKNWFNKEKDWLSDFFWLNGISNLVFCAVTWITGSILYTQYHADYDSNPPLPFGTLEQSYTLISRLDNVGWATGITGLISLSGYILYEFVIR